MRRHLLLACLALAVPTAAQAQDGAAQDPVAAIVNGAEIKRSELQMFLQTLPEQYQQMPLEMVYAPVLDRVIDGKLLAARAEAEGLPADPAVEAAIATARSMVLRDQLLRRTWDQAATDEAIQAAFEEAKGRPDFAYEEVNARHILVPTEDEAKAVLAEIAAGQAFADVAKAKSQDPGSKDRGGDLGWFRKDAMVAPFAEAAFTIPPGSVGPSPVQTEFGWHVIEVVDKRMHEPTLDEMRPELAQVVGRQAIDALLASVRDGAQIQRFGLDGKELPAQAAP